MRKHNFAVLNRPPVTDYIKNDLGILLLRVTCGGMLFLHGLNSAMHGMEPIKRILESHSLPGFLAWGNFIGEVVAPLFLVAGFKTRLAALVIAFNMLMSILIAHRDIMFARGDFGGWMIELNVFYLVTAIVIFLLGAGRFSIDGRALAIKS